MNKTITPFVFAAALLAAMLASTGVAHAQAVTYAPGQTAIRADSFSIRTSGTQTSVNFFPLKTGTYTVVAGGQTKNVTVTADDAGDEASIVFTLGDAVGDAVLSFGGNEVARASLEQPAIEAGSFNIVTSGTQTLVGFTPLKAGIYTVVADGQTKTLTVASDELGDDLGIIFMFGDAVAGDAVLSFGGAEVARAPLGGPAIKAGSFEITYSANGRFAIVNWIPLKAGTYSVKLGARTETKTATSSELGSPVNIGFGFGSATVTGTAVLSFGGVEVARQKVGTPRPTIHLRAPDDSAFADGANRITRTGVLVVLAEGFTAGTPPTGDTWEVSTNGGADYNHTLIKLPLRRPNVRVRLTREGSYTDNQVRARQTISRVRSPFAGLAAFIYDATPPVITLTGDARIVLDVGETYTDQGATAADKLDDNVQNNLMVDSSAVDTTTTGTYTVTYSATDHAGNVGTATREVVVRGQAANRNPLANAGLDQGVDTGAEVTLNGAVSSDPDTGDTLSYAWTHTLTDGNPPTTAITLTDTVRPTFTAPATAATLTFSLIVTDDDDAASPADTVTITVTVPNQRPVANAGPDQPNAVVGSPVTLDGSGSDSETATDDLTYFWSQAEGPDVDLSNDRVDSPTFTPPRAGTYIFNLTVTDTGNPPMLTTDKVIITVSEPVTDTTAPVLTFDRFEHTGGEVVATTTFLNVGDTLTAFVNSDEPLAATSLVGAAFFDFDGDKRAAQNLLRVGVTNQYKATYTITIDDDDAGLQFNVRGVMDTADPANTTPDFRHSLGTVTIDNSAPVITLEGDSSVAVAHGGTYTEDEDDGISGAGRDGTTAMTTTGPDAVTVNGIVVDTTTPGAYLITYIVTDPAGNVAELTRTVTVGALVDTAAPVITFDRFEHTGGIDDGTTTFLNVGDTLTAFVNSDEPLAAASLVDAALFDFDGSERDAQNLLPVVGVTNQYRATYTIKPEDDDTNPRFNVRGVMDTADSANTTDDFSHLLGRVTVDTSAPVITLLGNSLVAVAHGDAYTDMGVSGVLRGETLQTTIAGPDGATALDTNTAGDYTYTYIATDPAGNVSNMLTRTVTVGAPPPVVTPPATPIMVNENTATVHTFIATTTATDGRTVASFALAGDDAGDFSITNAGVLTFDPTPDFEAPTDANTDNDYEITVTATDNGTPTETSAAVTVTVSVANVDEAGTATISGTAQVGVELTASATDPDGAVTAAQYQWRSAAGVVSGAPRDSATYTPDADDVGRTLQVTVVYSDPVYGNKSVTSAPTAAVLAAPDTTAPMVTIPALGESTVGNRASVEITFDEAVTGLTGGDFTATNAMMIEVSPDSGANTAYTVTYTPRAAGAVSLTLAANSVSDTAATPNTGPASPVTANGNAAAAATEDTTKPRITAQMTIAGLTTAEFDADNFRMGMARFLNVRSDDVHILSITAASVIVEYEVVTTADQLDALAATLSGAGASQLRTASGQTLPGGAAVTNTEAQTSQPLVADAGNDQRNVDTGAMVTLDGSGSTGDELEYAWTQDTGATVTLSSTAVVTPTFTAPAQANDLVFTLTVTDKDGVTATDTVRIFVTASTAFRIALHEDTGIDGDGITRNGVVNVMNPGAGWSYTTDGGGTSIVGTGATSFTLPEGVYDANDVVASQVGEDVETAELGAVTVDSTDPTVVTFDNIAAGVIGTPQEHDITFSEALDFVSADITAEGATVNRVTSDDGITHTINFTPDAAAFSLTLDVDSVMDLAGNEGPDAEASASGSANQPPTAEAGPPQTEVAGTEVTLAGSGNDPDGNNDDLTYSWALTGGTGITLSDANIAAPTFTPTAAGTYTFTLTVADAGAPEGSATDTVIITVTANTAPEITAGNAAPNYAENADTPVETYTATDAEGNAIIWSITGGTDAALFSIAPNSAAPNKGELTFNNPPDFEDDAHTETYEVTITATETNGVPSNLASAPLAVTVTVTNVEEPGAISDISGTARVSVELTAGTVTDADGAVTGITHTWQSAGGDGTYTAISGAGTGATYTPVATDEDRTIQVIATYTDGEGSGKAVTSNPTAAVQAATPTKPVVTPPPTTPIVFAENDTAEVHSFSATTTDSRTITSYALGGADADDFSITNAGVLTFSTLPNFEAAADANNDNDYEITITATDSESEASDALAVTVRVANAEDAGSVSAISGTAQVGETLTAGTMVTDEDSADTISITGYQWRRLPSGGGPVDIGTDQVTYDVVAADLGATLHVVVSYTDDFGDNIDTATSNPTGAVQAATLTKPTVVAPATPIEFAENATGTVATFTATPTGSRMIVSFALGGTGADEHLFDLTSDGVLTFKIPPNFEAPADADNDYEITITATDDANETSDALAVTITVTNVDEDGMAFIDGTAQVGQVLMASVTDPDGEVTGALYQWQTSGISVSGDLRASTTYTLVDADEGNTLRVVVSYSDGFGGNTDIATSASTTAVQAAAATPTKPVVTPPTTTPIVFAENDTAEVHSFSATTTDSRTITSYALGGDDADDFSITNAGVLTFSTPPDFEMPTDANTDNDYEITVTATDDASGTSDAVAVTVTVTNVEETGTIGDITGTAQVGVELTAGTVTDPDGVVTGITITYRWQSAGADSVYTAISGAGTTSTYTPDADDVGKTIQVIATYTDGAGSGKKEVTSAPTATVTDERFADLNAVILPEMARAIADQTVSAITQRISQAGNGGNARSVTIAGQSTLAGAASAHGQAIADGTLSLKDVLGNSDFVLPLSDAGGPDSGILSSLTLWGGGGYRSLEGSGGTIDWDGGLFSAHLGLDGRPRDDLLTGLTVSWSHGDLDYQDGDDSSGDYKLDLTSVHPYVSWEALAGQLDLWATASYGWGDLEITAKRKLVDEQDQASSDVEAWNVAVGSNAQLSRAGPVLFQLKSSALLTEMEVEGSDDIAGLEVESSLLRMILEGAYKHTLADGTYVEPSLEAGVRYDGGDGETGFGAELGAGFRYTDPTAGLTLEGRARTLVGRDNYEEWGVSGLILLEQSGSGRGLSFSLSPGYGDTGSGTQKVWQQGLGDEVSGDQSYGARLDARLGYGLTAPGGRGLLTPYSEMTLGDSSRSYRLGMRWELDALFDLNLTGERRESNSNVTDHAIMLKGDIRF